MELGEAKATPFSPDSRRCASVQPNTLVATSAAVGWTALLVDQLEGTDRCDPFDTHPTPDLTLVVAMSGSHEIEVFRNRRWYRALYQAGASGLTPPHDVVRLRWKSDHRGLPFQTAHLYLPASVLTSTAEEYRRAGQSCPDHPCSELIFADPAVAAIAVELIRGMRAGAPNVYADQAAHWLAAHLLFRHAGQIDLDDGRSPGSFSDRRLARTIEFMSANFDAPLSLAQLASEAGISVHHFSRLFKQQTGMTPASFLTSMRMTAARRLIRTSDLAIGEVAKRCGYTRAAAFTAAFSRHFGESPLAARKRVV